MAASLVTCVRRSPTDDQAARCTGSVARGGAVCYNLPAMLRKAIFLSITILSVAAVTVGALYWLQLGRTGTAALFVEEGEATVRRGIRTLRLVSTQAYEVRSGDEIRTVGNSRALLVVSPATSVVLQSECEVLVRGLSWEEAGASVADLQLGAGETLHQVH